MPDSLKRRVEEWLQRGPRIAGVEAFGVRFPDRTSTNRSFREGFPEVALDNAWGCVADTLQVLRTLRYPVQRLRWVFEHYLIDCAVRSDGVLLGVFLTRQSNEVDYATLDRMVEGFLAMQ